MKKIVTLLLLTGLLVSCCQVVEENKDDKKENVSVVNEQKKVELTDEQKKVFTKKAEGPLDGMAQVEEQKRIVTEQFKDYKDEEILLLSDKDNSYLEKHIHPSVIETGKPMKQILKVVDDDSELGKKMLENIKAIRGNNYSYPVFFYKEDTQYVKFDEVPEDYKIKVEDGDNVYYTFTEPMMAQLPKYLINLDETDTKVLEDFTINKNTNPSSSVNILVVTDPLCSHCAQAFNDEVTNEVLGKYNVDILMLGLLSEPSAIITDYIHRSLDKELLGNVFNNQEELNKSSKEYTNKRDEILSKYSEEELKEGKISEDDISKLQELPKIILDKLESFDVDNSIKLNEEGIGLTAIDQQILTMKLGVFGTPTMYVHDKINSKLYLIPNFNYLPFILDETNKQEIE